MKRPSHSFPCVIVYTIECECECEFIWQNIIIHAYKKTFDAKENNEISMYTSDEVIEVKQSLIL